MFCNLVACKTSVTKIHVGCLSNGQLVSCCCDISVLCECRLKKQTWTVSSVEWFSFLRLLTAKGVLDKQMLRNWQPLKLFRGILIFFTYKSRDRTL